MTTTIVDIQNLIKNFKSGDTVLYHATDLKINGYVDQDIYISNNKNTIVILNGYVLGTVNLNFIINQYNQEYSESEQLNQEQDIYQDILQEHEFCTDEYHCEYHQHLLQYLDLETFKLEGVAATEKAKILIQDPKIIKNPLIIQYRQDYKEIYNNNILSLGCSNSNNSPIILIFKKSDTMLQQPSSFNMNIKRTLEYSLLQPSSTDSVLNKSNTGLIVGITIGVIIILIIIIVGIVVYRNKKKDETVAQVPTVEGAQ